LKQRKHLQVRRSDELVGLWRRLSGACYASGMNAPEALILDLLEWLAVKPRPYGEVMANWRTSCPRLPVWEDAVDLGLVERSTAEDGEACVRLTPAGETRLLARRQRE
jgi:hypothetical protein